MKFEILDESQVKKYSTLDVEKFAAKKDFKKAAEKLFDGRKILKGEKAEQEFRFEYDDILEEVEEIRDYEICELKKMIPETWEYISKVKGSAIYKSIDKGNLTDALKLDTNVEKKINNIKNNELLDEIQKKQRIKMRQNIQKEIKNFEKAKDEEFGKDICWKIWHVAEKERVIKNLKEKGEKNYKKYMEKIKAIGIDKLDEIAEVYSERYYED